MPAAKDPRDIVVPATAGSFTDLSQADRDLCAQLSVACGDVDLNSTTQLPFKMGLFFGWVLIKVGGAQGRTVVQQAILKGLSGAQLKTAMRGFRTAADLNTVLTKINATVVGIGGT